MRYIAACFTLLAACATVLQPLGSSTEIADDIREAMFAYLVADNPLGSRSDAQLYFLCVQRGDPSQSLLDNVAKHSAFPLKPCSAFRVEFDPKSLVGRIIDQQSGKHGLAFSVDEIKREGRTAHVIASGEFSRSEFTLRFRGGQWHIVSARVIAVASGRGLTRCWNGLRPADLLVCFAPAARRAEAVQL